MPKQSEVYKTYRKTLKKLPKAIPKQFVQVATKSVNKRQLKSNRDQK